MTSFGKFGGYAITDAFPQEKPSKIPIPNWEKNQVTNKSQQN